MAALAVTEAAGASLMKRAVELDTEERYTEALVFYQSGIQELMEALKGIKEETKRTHFRQKISSYMDRAEKLKDHVEQEKEAGKYHEQIRIENNATGFSYEKIFGRFLDPLLTEVEVEDPYVRSFHQVNNFLRLCELLVTSKAMVKRISLITGMDDHPNSQHQQKSNLAEMQRSLSDHGVKLDVQYRGSLHDREIRFNNGWIIKIGRGLDYFRQSSGKFVLGYSDYNLRPCYETTVDIFHRKNCKTKANPS